MVTKNEEVTAEELVEAVETMKENTLARREFIGLLNGMEREFLSIRKELRDLRDAMQKIKK